MWPLSGFRVHMDGFDAATHGAEWLRELGGGGGGGAGED